MQDLFSLRITHASKETHIVMKLFIREVHTGRMNKTHALLEKHLPTILRSQCINEENLPFAHEVRRTEIGHLFEHILLEYLCQLKLQKGHEEAIFSGTTDWNWNVDPKGTFRISVSVGKENLDIFPEALTKAQELLTLILTTHIEREKESFFPSHQKETGPVLPLLP